MTISQDFDWLKTHLILLAVVMTLSGGTIFGVESLISKHDAQVASHYEAIAADTAKQNAAIQAQTQQQIALLSAQNAQLAQQVASLSSAISARDAQLVKQQAQVKTLTPVQVASTIQPFLKQGTATVTTGGILLDTPASQEVLAQLEELPIRKADISDLQTIVGNQRTQIGNLSTENGSLTTALNSEKASHKADNIANAKTITALKADARKSKLKWFGIGYVAGFTSGLVLKAAAII